MDLGGDLSERILRSMALTAAEEATAAEAAHAALLPQYRGRLLPTPRAARKVFDVLVAALPPPLKPPPFRFVLTVLDGAEINAFTVGGGHVYLSRGLLAALTPETEAGRAVLAFVLAHELGHGALGHCRRGYELREVERDLQRDVTLRVKSAEPALRPGDLDCAGGKIAHLPVHARAAAPGGPVRSAPVPQRRPRPRPLS